MSPKDQLKEKQAASSQESQVLFTARDIIASFPGGQLAVSSDIQQEATPIYLIDERNVVSVLSSRALKLAVHAHTENYTEKHRKEVILFMELELAKEGAVLNPAIVQPVAFADEPTKLTWNRLAMNKSDINKVTLDQLPGFAHILSLCDDPVNLTRWIGSILDPKAGRTQYLHIQGSGANGKSTLFEGIESVIGSKFVVRTRSSEFMNQHWGSHVEGARLLIFADENNTGFFSNGKFKEFTGESTATVNPKHRDQRTIQLTHKTVVFSNNKVEITTNIADRRRLLSITMQDDPDPNPGFKWWYDELKYKGAEILAYCYSEYIRAVEERPSVRAFIIPDSKTISAAIERKYAPYADELNEHFTFTGDLEDRVKRSVVHKTIATELRERATDRMFLQQLKEALSTRGVSVGFSHGGVAVYRGMKEGPPKEPRAVQLVDQKVTSA